ncbi:MAG TPA: hypothetical protein VGR35_20985 [Tepidisphaeraceae bacterium]|nr:hypothetical protein [Tepidisphaeraceae bacterium]
MFNDLSRGFLATFISACCCAYAAPAHAAQTTGRSTIEPGTRPATQADERATTSPAEGETLRLFITAVSGAVQARRPGQAKWEPVTVGTVLEEGSDLRTLPKSSVQFQIPPDQTFALDRASTIRVLRATFADGKLTTDVGMPYGRLRYDIEAEGREHDTTIRSPNSILAVRGTKVALYDQPPFAPQAISLTGTASFRDAKKRLAFGGRGKTRVRAGVPTAAELALAESVVDPSIQRARTPGEEQLVADLISRGAVTFFDPVAGIDVVRGGGPFTAEQFLTSAPGALNAVLTWDGNADWNLGVSVQGFSDFIFPGFGLNRGAETGGVTAFDHRGGDTTGGVEIVFFPKGFSDNNPCLNIDFLAAYVSGGASRAELQLIRDGQLLGLEPAVFEVDDSGVGRKLQDFVPFEPCEPSIQLQQSIAKAGKTTAVSSTSHAHVTGHHHHMHSAVEPLPAAKVLSHPGPRVLATHPR